MTQRDISIAIHLAEAFGGDSGIIARLAQMESDLMAEWRNRGLIMAASDTLLGCLGLTPEELVGLQWQEGLSETTINKLLALPKSESLDVLWQFDEAALPFTVSRDSEHAAMWWKLKF